VRSPRARRAGRIRPEVQARHRPRLGRYVNSLPVLFPGPAGPAGQRGKIGVSPGRARPILGSYNAEGAVLTLVTYTLPADAGARDYVNSLWEPQREPYRGDAINSYNDGPAAPGAAPFGPFYELETSSPALALAPDGSAEHVHRTLHFVGAPEELDVVARASLGVGIAEITSRLGGPA
jgi:hypothetical protein